MLMLTKVSRHLGESNAEVVYQFSLQDQELELSSRAGQDAVSLWSSRRDEGGGGKL